jgi:hypothetical protein
MILPKTQRELVLMGYEPQAILYLLNQKTDPILGRPIKEDEIRVGKEVPLFRYHTDDQKEHIYFPDIHLKDTNVIVEVKSLYTLHYHLYLNYLKFKKVVEDGYQLRLLMFRDYKMNLIDLTFSSLEEVKEVLLL